MTQAAIISRPLAYRLDHPVHGTELSIRQPDDDWAARGWHVTPLCASAVQKASQSSALSDIANERQRQIDVEGWTHKHDDVHDKGEMAHAAGSYALATSEHLLWVGGDEFPLTWPWHKRWWKPKDRRSDLIKAGALILAEIERLDRASALPPQERQP